ncbi:unnamed protein product [Effrenium voratum]|uniref:Uncharacterized protein n=1 Tax=Effrenium voratum TaxID=2562239 RepID=A0AA36NID2_9DINO|nr:unnamed protein product [Effrenium voratum]CAJ1408382.1 unnamed protein product [Effrenium voratum]CAJ1456762.1 unnamed protein product [Effrenium voratum]
MSLSRPSCAGYDYGILLTTMSQNKQAPKWSFAGRQHGGSRPGTPGPGAYAAAAKSSARIRTPSYGFGTAERDGGGLRVSTAPGPGTYGAYGAYGAHGQARPRSAGPAFGRARRGLGGGSATPGPGAYVPNINPTRMGAPRHTCTPRRDGVFGGGGSQGAFGTPGPGTYGDAGSGGSSPMAKAAPRWGFGSSARGVNAYGQGPGPGQYDLRSRVGGPRFSIKGRHDLGDGSLCPTPGPGSFGGMYTQFGY